MNWCGSGRPSVSAKAVSKRKSIHEESGIGRYGLVAHQRSGACVRASRSAVRQRSGRFASATPLCRAQPDGVFVVVILTRLLLNT